MALIRGTLDALVLKTLCWGPMHGFEIIRWLEERSGNHFVIENAALLQALHRLEERRLVAGEWGVSDNNRRARYYSLTPAGRAQLRAETQAIRESFAALDAILSARAPAARNA